MTLKIVWRNSIPKEKPKNVILRVAEDERLAVYIVSNAETTEEFAMLFGGAA